MKPVSNNSQPSKWRDYQLQFKKNNVLQRSLRRIPFYAALIVILVLLGHGLSGLLHSVRITPDTDNATMLFSTKETTPPGREIGLDKKIDKQSLQKIFNEIP